MPQKIEGNWITRPLLPYRGPCRAGEQAEIGEAILLCVQHDPFSIDRIYLATVVFFALGQARAAEAKRPNILLVMADDLGWMDLARQQQALWRHRTLDSLAKQGMRFINAYAATGLFSHKGRCAHGAGFQPGSA